MGDNTVVEDQAQHFCIQSCCLKHHGSIPYNLDDRNLFFDIDIFKASTNPSLVSHFDDDDHFDLFFDKEVTSPALPRGLVSSNNIIHDTFEFHISFPDEGSNNIICADDVTPADELFYQGQLLPLDTPSRRWVLEHQLSTTITSESFNSPAAFTSHCKSDAIYNPENHLGNSSGEYEPHRPEDCLSWSSSQLVRNNGPKKSRLREGPVTLQAPYESLDSGVKIVDDGPVRKIVTAKPYPRWKVCLPRSLRTLKHAVHAKPANDRKQGKGRTNWVSSVFKFLVSLKYYSANGRRKR